jgi:hypothetical protein
MPEAFDFGDFFTSLLPTIAGIALAPGTAGGSLVASGLGQTAAAAAPIVGGMATGALVAGAKGDDPLMGGLMGGLGGYGGGNLAKTFTSMGANAAANTANVANAATSAGGYTTPAMEEALKKGVAGPMIPNAQAANTALLQPGTFNPALSQSIPGATVATMPTGSENLMSGLKQFGSDPFGAGYDAFKQAGGSAFDLAAPIGMAGLAGAQEDLYPKGDNSLEEKRKAEENKYRDPITGRLNLAQASPGLRLATGGTVNTNSSTISSGGIQDLYGTNDQTTGTQNLSKEGYGIGRLNSLAAEGSRAKAADTFYAAGGPIAFAEGGSSDIKIPGYDGSALNVNDFSSGSGMGGDALYSINNAAAMSPILKMLFEKMPQSARGEFIGSGLGSFFGLQERPKQEYYTSSGKLTSDYAHGGYLNGHGDGMSDSIPATIEGKQPARLADGEFVIPADVVSHIGNGSSKAGSKQLYSMLDRIRKARTGHTKQGKEIKPQKYMPA